MTYVAVVVDKLLINLIIIIIISNKKTRKQQHLHQHQNQEQPQQSSQMLADWKSHCHCVGIATNAHTHIFASQFAITYIT